MHCSPSPSIRAISLQERTRKIITGRKVCEGSVFINICLSTGGVSQHALAGVCIPLCTGKGDVSQHALGRRWGCLPRSVSA